MRISGGITLTVLSDLNGPSPQFTLTCVSTGGPATTVTWTRDSTTVIEDDSVTAQYTHTLTVTGHLGGLYACTVSNNKPSSASASITVTGNTLFSLIHSSNSLIWLAHLYTTSLSVPSHIPLSFFPFFFLHKILSFLTVGNNARYTINVYAGGTFSCSPVAAHIKGADELLICAMPAARNVNIIHLLFALQPML